MTDDNNKKLYTGFGVTFNEIKFSNFTLPSDFATSYDSYITDVDGDIVSADNIEAIDITYSWENNSLISDLNQSLSSAEDFCENNGGNYLGPYELKITGKLKANSTYGIPRDTEKAFEKTYKVDAKDGICYIRPGVLALNKPNGWPEGGNNWSLGSDNVNRNPAYNSTVFKEHVGFKSWIDGDKFPTMAFLEA